MDNMDRFMNCPRLPYCQKTVKIDNTLSVPYKETKKQDEAPNRLEQMRCTIRYKTNWSCHNPRWMLCCIVFTVLKPESCSACSRCSKTNLQEMKIMQRKIDQDVANMHEIQAETKTGLKHIGRKARKTTHQQTAQEGDLQHTWIILVWGGLAPENHQAIITIFFKTSYTAWYCS